MRLSLNKFFTIWIYLVLFSLLMNLIFDLNEEEEKAIHIAMFSTIGLYYIAAGWAFNRKWLKILLFISGSYLVVMNLLSSDNNWVQIFGILCILSPMIVVKFFLKEEIKYSQE